MATKSHVEAAADLQQRHAQAVDRIRSREDLTPAAKLDRLRAVQDEHASAMAQLQQSANTETAVQRGRLYQQAFSSQNLPGDPSTLVVSVRDAQDRASRITDPKDAVALLQRAELSGDEALARAVAEHAFTQTKNLNGLGSEPWGEVVETYAARREPQAQALSELSSMDRGGSGVARALSEAGKYYLPVPSELQGPGGWQPSRVSTYDGSDAAGSAPALVDSLPVRTGSSLEGSASCPLHFPRSSAPT